MPVTLTGLIPFLLSVVVLCIVLYIVKLVLDMIALPPPVKTIVWLIVGLVALIVLLSQLGVIV